MSRKHGSYSKKEWLEAAAGASGEAGAAASGHDSFAEAAQAAPTTEAATEVKPEATQVASELAGRFSAMKDKIAGALSVVVWTPLQEKFKLPPLSASDRKILSEGWQACLDCLDVQPEITPLALRPRSRLLLLLFPLSALLLVLAEKMDVSKLFDSLMPKPNAPKPNHRSDSAEGERKDVPVDETHSIIPPSLHI